MRMTWQVVSFNRHYFAMALLACAISAAVVVLVDNAFVRGVCLLGVGLATYFMVVSIIASYCIYDASDLYKLNEWPKRSLRRAPSSGIVLHAGFDPASAEIRAKFPEMTLRVLDFFSSDQTTEASIQVARRLHPRPPSTEPTRPDEWPIASATQDVVFVLNAAHELRQAEERAALFREARRVLNDEGQVIVIEQLRNLASFACFGIAAYHFLSRRTWSQAFSAAQLAIRDEFSITPFLRVFVLEGS